VCVCACVCVCARACVSLSLALSFSLALSLSLSLALALSLCLSICLSICLSVYHTALGSDGRESHHRQRFLCLDQASFGRDHSFSFCPDQGPLRLEHATFHPECPGLWRDVLAPIASMWSL